MFFDYNVLDDSEKLIYALRSLFRQAGFTQYRMSKFEEYDFYSKNKDFLVSENIKDRMQGASIHNEVFGSDHCPVELLWE